MSRLLIPYHLDEELPGFDAPFAADTTLTVTLPDGDVVPRLRFLYERAADAVAADVRDGGRPTVMSGDCTASIAVVAGLQRAGVDPAIVWFDAHGDVQSPETSSSGYLGGMPLRMLMGDRPDLLTADLGIRPVGPERVVLVDARDLDPPEIEFLHGSSVVRRGVYDFVGESAGEPGGDAAGVAGLPDGPIYLHIDFDVADPGELPGLLYPAPGGPGLDTVLVAVRRIMESGRVAGLGLGCTWRPGCGTVERLRRHDLGALM